MIRSAVPSVRQPRTRSGRSPGARGRRDCPRPRRAPGPLLPARVRVSPSAPSHPVGGGRATRTAGGPEAAALQTSRTPSSAALAEPFDRGPVAVPRPPDRRICWRRCAVRVAPRSARHRTCRRLDARVSRCAWGSRAHAPVQPTGSLPEVQRPWCPALSGRPAPLLRRRLGRAQKLAATSSCPLDAANHHLAARRWRRRRRRRARPPARSDSRFVTQVRPPGPRCRRTFDHGLSGSAEHAPSDRGGRRALHDRTRARSTLGGSPHEPI